MIEFVIKKHDKETPRAIPALKYDKRNLRLSDPSTYGMKNTSNMRILVKYYGMSKSELAPLSSI